MIRVTIRRQGGAAIMTIPADVLKLLNVDVGSTLQIEVENGSIRARPMTPAGPRKHYTLSELLHGVTPALMAKLNADTEWARDGAPIGREL